MTLVFLFVFLVLLFIATYYFIINKTLKEKLAQLATIDAATGLKNASASMAATAQLLKTAKRYRQPLTLALIKVTPVTANQEEWIRHPRIIAMSQLLKQQFRDTDLIGRLGHDCFILVLNQTHSHDARAVFERLLQAFDGLNSSDSYFQSHLGVAQLNETIETTEALVNSAEKALNMAKSSATNRVQYAP